MIDKSDNKIMNQFADLPRKQIQPGRKEMVWMKVQNHIRSSRENSVERIPIVKKLTEIFTLRTLASKMALGALIVIFAISLVRGAAQAIPGETLYPVKKATEKVEKVLATSQEAKVKVAVKHANRRLEEVKQLVEEKKEPAIVSKTITELRKTTDSVVAAVSEDKPELINQAVELAAKEHEILSDAHEQSEGETKDALNQAILDSQLAISKLQQTDDQDGDTHGATLSSGNDINSDTETSSSDQDTTQSTTTNVVSTPTPTKKQDSVLESNIQINDVFKGKKSD